VCALRNNNFGTRIINGSFLHIIAVIVLQTSPIQPNLLETVAHKFKHNLKVKFLKILKILQNDLDEMKEIIKWCVTILFFNMF